MKLKIDQWCSVKGLTIKHKQYSASVFCNALKVFRSRSYPDKYKTPFTKDLIFSIKRNRKTSILVWDTDITVLGFTFQFQEYKPEYVY